MTNFNLDLTTASMIGRTILVINVLTCRFLFFIPVSTDRYQELGTSIQFGKFILPCVCDSLSCNEAMQFKEMYRQA